MSQLKIALIGTGGWARQHARILQNRADVDFCAVVGRDAARTEARALEFGTRPYTSIETMLGEQKPDLVCVCLPNTHHFEATRQIIEAGFPLLVEKPLVFEMEQANALLAAAREKNLFFAINFNHRYARPLQMAKESIENGKIGEIVFASWRFGGEGRGEHPDANLIETQCHGFDLLEWLCGPIVSIMAQMTDMTNNGFSSFSLALKFHNGAVGSLLGSYDSSYAYRETQRLEINGTKGRVLVADTVKRFEFQASGEESAQIWEAGYFNDSERAFERTFDAHFEAILKAFRDGKSPPIGAQAGKRALQLALGAIESFETGRRIEIAEI